MSGCETHTDRSNFPAKTVQTKKTKNIRLRFDYQSTYLQHVQTKQSCTEREKTSLKIAYTYQIRMKCDFS